MNWRHPCNLLRSFEKLLSFGAEAASAHAIPDDDEANGDGKNKCGDSVDFRGDAAAKAAPDFERQSIVPANEEKGDGNLVHGQREDEQAGGDQRELEIRKSDAPESLPRRRAEVEGSFFLSVVHFLQASEELGGSDRNERGAVAEKNGEQAELGAGKDSEHEQVEAGDDAGMNQRQENEAAEESFSGKGGAVERKGGKQPQGQRECHAAGGDDQAFHDGVPDRGVGKKLAVPIEREMAGRETADAVTIEGVKNENGDRQIDEDQDEGGINREERSAAGCSLAAHLKDHRFSSRSLRKSKEMVIIRMQTEIAAPSGQSYAAPKRLCTTLAIIVPEAPPTRSGARKSPSDRAKAKVAPASRPGMERGKMTRKNV